MAISTTGVTASPEQLCAATSGLGLAPVFQPVVDLQSCTTVGFEALARWTGLPDVDPESVLRYAADAGRLSALDAMLRRAAIGEALNAGLGRDRLLLVNCEPTADFDPDEPMTVRARDDLRVVFELTERSLLRHPRALLRKVAALRASGFGVAMDDVGINPDSLALLDVVAPDIVKLDLRLVQSRPRLSQARTLAAVLAHHERTGAAILAEGIETDAHLEQARAIGATLGQGWRFAAARPLPGPEAGAERSGRAVFRGPTVQTRQVPRAPFDLVAGHEGTRVARKDVLVAFSRQIEAQAAATAASDPPIVLAALQEGANFTGVTESTYRDLAAHSPLVAVFGVGLEPDPGSPVKTVGLRPRDPLRYEWTVVVLNAHMAAALIASEADPVANRGRCEADREFRFTVTYDRPLVTAAARSLLGRMI